LTSSHQDNNDQRINSQPLVDIASESPVALFGITGLARRVCNNDMAACENSEDIMLLSERLNNLIGSCQQYQPENEIKVCDCEQHLID